MCMLIVVLWERELKKKLEDENDSPIFNCMLRASFLFVRLDLLRSFLLCHFADCLEFHAEVPTAPNCYQTGHAPLRPLGV